MKLYLDPAVLFLLSLNFRSLSSTNREQKEQKHIHLTDSVRHAILDYVKMKFILFVPCIQTLVKASY